MDYSKINKKWWNSIVSIHENSKLYNLAAFRKGKSSLQSIELKELGNVKDKSLLHLMCHFGMDTLSWAREGAHVTGVDISDASIKRAIRLSQELHIPAEFICSDIYKLPTILNKKFDIIFTSYGVLLWLSSITKWAHVINHFLKKGGVFYIAELHPFTNIFNHKFEVDAMYFDKGPYKDESSGSYTDWEADIKGVTYMWSYTISDVINALVEEGLKIEFVHEFPFTMYEQFPGLMKKNNRGHYFFKDKNIQIPLLFSLKASK